MINTSRSLVTALLGLMVLIQLACIGRGIPIPPWPLPDPDVRLEPESLHYEPTWIGTDGNTQQIVITNISSKYLTLDQITVNGGPFVRVDNLELPTTLSPTESLPFQFDFLPSEVESYHGWVSFKIEDEVIRSTAHLSGRGITNGNLTPEVDLGPDLEIALSDMVMLTPEIMHDDLPGDSDSLTYNWFWESAGGTGDVILPFWRSPSTEMYCTREGDYRVWLKVDDGELTDTDEMLVTVGPSTSNLKPEVDAGQQNSSYLPHPLLLEGSYFDDGLPGPPEEVTIQWSLRLGPDEVDFHHPDQLSTLVWFKRHGVHILKLEVSDGEFAVSDEISIEVREAW